MLVFPEYPHFQFDIAIDESSVSVTSVLGGDYTVVGHEYDVDRERYVIHLDREFEYADDLLNDITVSVGFTTYIRDGPLGKLKWALCSAGKNKNFNAFSFVPKKGNCNKKESLFILRTLTVLPPHQVSSPAPTWT